MRTNDRNNPEMNGQRITRQSPGMIALQLNKDYRAGTIRCPVQAVLAIDRSNRVCLGILNVSNRSCSVSAQWATVGGSWICEAVDPDCGSPLDGVELLRIELTGRRRVLGAYAPGSRLSACYELDRNDLNPRGIRNGTTSPFVNVNVNGKRRQLEPTICLLKHTLEKEFEIRRR